MNMDFLMIPSEEFCINKPSTGAASAVPVCVRGIEIKGDMCYKKNSLLNKRSQ